MSAIGRGNALPKPNGPASASKGCDLIARERLLHAVELLPDNASVTLPREVLVEALRGPEPTAAEVQSPPSGDQLMTAKQVSEVLKVSPRWVYENADSLPFTRRIKRGVLRFSEKGLHKYVSTKHRPCRK